MSDKVISEKKIGEREYRAIRVLATKSIKMQVRIAKVLGVGIKDFASATKEAQSGNEGPFLELVYKVIDHIEEDSFTRLCGEILTHVQLKSPSGQWVDVDLDGHFGNEHNPELVPVIIYAGLAVFKDYFGKVDWDKKAVKVEA